MLKIDDLQVTLEDKEILKHIDLEIHPGETHVLFGPNGSGKNILIDDHYGVSAIQSSGRKDNFQRERHHSYVHKRTGSNGHRDVLPASSPLSMD